MSQSIPSFRRPNSPSPSNAFDFLLSLCVRLYPLYLFEDASVAARPKGSHPRTFPSVTWFSSFLSFMFHRPMIVAGLLILPLSSLEIVRTFFSLFFPFYPLGGVRPCDLYDVTFPSNAHFFLEAWLFFLSGHPYLLAPPLAKAAVTLFPSVPFWLCRGVDAGCDRSPPSPPAVAKIFTPCRIPPQDRVSLGFPPFFR